MRGELRAANARRRRPHRLSGHLSIAVLSLRQGTRMGRMRKYSHEFPQWSLLAEVQNLEDDQQHGISPRSSALLQALLKKLLAGNLHHTV